MFRKTSFVSRRSLNACNSAYDLDSSSNRRMSEEALLHHFEHGYSCFTVLRLTISLDTQLGHTAS